MIPAEKRLLTLVERMNTRPTVAKTLAQGVLIAFVMFTFISGLTQTVIPLAQAFGHWVWQETQGLNAWIWAEPVTGGMLVLSINVAVLLTVAWLSRHPLLWLANHALVIFHREVVVRMRRLRKSKPTTKPAAPIREVGRYDAHG